jgi:hypothetical protein
MNHSNRPRTRRYGIGRWDFLRYMATVSAIPAIALRAEGQVTEQPRFTGNPFTLGVASGDPEPDGVVIWTRLAPQPLDGGGMPNGPVKVRWEVARDEAFGNVVRSGNAMAMPQLGRHRRNIRWTERAQAVVSGGTTSAEAIKSNDEQSPDGLRDFVKRWTEAIGVFCPAGGAE